MSTEAEKALARHALALLDLTELGDHASETDIAKLVPRRRGAQAFRRWLPFASGRIMWLRPGAGSKARASASRPW